MPSISTVIDYGLNDRSSVPERSNYFSSPQLCQIKLGDQLVQWVPWVERLEDAVTLSPLPST
jgi:hypothetical protein